MKKNLLLLTSVLTLAVLTPLARAEGDCQKGCDAKEKAECPADKGPRHGGKADMLKKFDANGDGKLDETEKVAMKTAREERRAEMLKKFDKNSDGTLDDAEKAEARAAREAAKPE
jgi:hypothetical protein